MEAFTPPALPGFPAIPASIPSQQSFAALLFTVGYDILDGTQKVTAKNCTGPPGLFMLTL